MWWSIYVIVLYLATVQGSVEDLLRIDSIVQEDPCSRAGGICTIASDCPKDNLSRKTGLCPEQHKQGVECCHGVSNKETRCVKHGGICVPEGQFCNPKMVSHDAKDCPDAHKCCILTY